MIDVFSLLWYISSSEYFGIHYMEWACLRFKNLIESVGQFAGLFESWIFKPSWGPMQGFELRSFFFISVLDGCFCFDAKVNTVDVASMPTNEVISILRTLRGTILLKLVRPTSAPEEWATCFTAFPVWADALACLFQHVCGNPGTSYFWRFLSDDRCVWAVCSAFILSVVVKTGKIVVFPSFLKTAESGVP